MLLRPQKYELWGRTRNWTKWEGSPSGTVNQTQMGGWGVVGPRVSWDSGKQLDGLQPCLQVG